MSKKRDEKLFAYEVFMAQATKEGRVRREELSMKVLKPDLSLQARVDHINLDHVRALHEILKNGQPLAPIVVFEIAPGKFKIVDGFHRHEVYRKEGLGGIPCIVVKGTMQEAIEYAASANQQLSLKRTREDVKKAVCMLLDNGWLNKSTVLIARQAGCATQTVVKYRTEYCAKTHASVPDVFCTAGGQQRRRQIKDGPPRINSYTRSAGGIPEFRSRLKGKDVYLGNDRETAEKKLQAMWESARSEPLPGARSLRYLLASRGLDVSPSQLNMIGGYVYQNIGFLSIADGGLQEIFQSIAKVLLLAAEKQCSRSVVLTRSETVSKFAWLIDIARRIGVEFMTLDEFVAAVKADEASQSEGRAS